MSPQLRRYLPFILGAFVLLFLLPALFKKSSSTTTTPSTQSAEALKTINLVDRSEQRYQSAHGRYSSQVADLIVESHPLAQDLAEGVTVQLDVSTDGKSYFALVQDPALSLVRARDAGKIVAESCVIVKSGSGVSCPATTTTPAKKT